MPSGQLEKAKLLAKEVAVELTVCFNPKDLTVSKSASWEPLNQVDDASPLLFGPTSPATMEVTLIFDTYEEKTSVYKKYTAQLERLIHVVSDKVRRPPLTHFIWGAFVFQGAVESLSQKYTLFLSNGMPVRAECTLTIKKSGQVMSRSRRGAGAPGTSLV